MGGEELTMGKKKTKETRMVERVMKEHFPNHPPEFPPVAYLHDSAFIHVRIVDKLFSKVPWYERLELVRPVIRTLPEKTQKKILLVALVSPSEMDTSPTNYEFEHPNSLPRIMIGSDNSQSAAGKRP